MGRRSHCIRGNVSKRSELCTEHCLQGKSSSSTDVSVHTALTVEHSERKLLWNPGAWTVQACQLHVCGKFSLCTFLNLYVCVYESYMRQHACDVKEVWSASLGRQHHITRQMQDAVVFVQPQSNRTASYFVQARKK